MKKHLLAAAALCCAGLGAGQALAEGDAAAGESIYSQCAACHATEEGVNRVGPSLYGVMGRVAGSAEGFNFSDAMKDSGLTWDEETMSGYLEDPRGYMPGNRMPYAGLKDEQQRADLIAYLATLGAE